MIWPQTHIDEHRYFIPATRGNESGIVSGRALQEGFFQKDSNNHCFVILDKVENEWMSKEWIERMAYQSLRVLKKILFISFFLVIMGCANTVPKDLVFFDFESDSELDRVHWKCHTLLSLSDEHSTYGHKSLKLELYPSEYPGLTPILRNHDWRGFQFLCFDIYNPQEKELRIAVRIDDRDDPDYADRYNHSFRLIPGLNCINIPLNELKTSGTKRNLDLNNIQALIIFMVNPTEKVVLYMDHIRLAV